MQKYILIRCYFIEVCCNFHRNGDSYSYGEAEELERELVELSSNCLHFYHFFNQFIYSNSLYH